ncbi:hypothetical protein [Labrys miyagiensis]|uniref:hypothetical protein n=1 Tax=Labrys miyagiensis TaxID=346912 RepID=UPI0024E066F5|nr:hypothetical protein [Labrys miyagiensis]
MSPTTTVGLGLRLVHSAIAALSVERDGNTTSASSGNGLGNAFASLHGARIARFRTPLYQATSFLRVRGHEPHAALGGPVHSILQHAVGERCGN